MAPISATALEILRRRSEYAVMTPCCIVLPRCNRWVVGVNNTNLRDNLVTEAEFVDLVVSAPRLRELVMFDWGFATISPRNLKRLAAANAFEYLEQWTIGWDGWLAMATFFDLLALMPNLKQLLIGRVAAADEDNLDDRDRAGSVTSVTSSDLDTSSTSQAATTRTRTPAHKFATPACSLEKLFVHDDWGIDFMEYPHLLSNSHHTLTHVEMHWIFDEEPGVQLAHALEKCINVRSLTFIGCNFKFGELLRICPRLVRLGMESMQSLFPEVWPPENDERTSSGSAIISRLKVGQVQKTRTNQMTLTKTRRAQRAP
ncbi:hypothetical protein BKA62DRAFT_502023 [Auriculariales sp. MPI-PUGE-AT-0066]|nr:hypothetical protein BKA62DRAFT_502023 [Auriculariales sp. MPI-PUGE-AT-0066]